LQKFDHDIVFFRETPIFSPTIGKNHNIDPRSLPAQTVKSYLVGMAECGNTFEGFMGVIKRCSVQAVSSVGGCNRRTSMFKLFC
jgi:hypothetical protein